MERGSVRLGRNTYQGLQNAGMKGYFRLHVTISATRNNLTEAHGAYIYILSHKSPLLLVVMKKIDKTKTSYIAREPQPFVEKEALSSA